jgi:hypothetical protein
VTVKAWLDGHPFDLETLTELFREGEPMVVQEGDAYYLTSAAFDGLLHEAGRLEEVACSALRRVNGVAWALDSSFRPVTLPGRFSDETGDTSVVVGAVTAEVRATAYVAAVVTSGEAQLPPPPPARGPEYFGKTANPNVRMLLTS